MKAEKICETAANYVGGDRDRQHGGKTKNHENIAALWNAYLDIRRDPGSPLTPDDVARMMVLLKLARTQLGDLNMDDYVDMAGYAACAGEMASAEAIAMSPPFVKERWSVMAMMDEIAERRSRGLDVA